LPQLREAEARVAQVLLDQVGELVHLSVSDIAALAGTAQSTVVRACQRLGFHGYQEVKIEAARDRPSGLGSAPDASDDVVGQALAQTVHAAVETLAGLPATLAVGELRAAAERIDAASRILVAGTGLSGATAIDAAYRLRALGLPVDLPPDPLTAQLAADLLPERAVCLAISHSGATRSTVDTARRARDRGATVVAVTSYARSPLTAMSTCVLVAGGQDLVFGLEAVASRLAHFTAIDALTLALRSLRGATADHALSVSAEVTAAHSY
jgi:RpiR family transcriptional regulator, carbohydrate utilization regulator